MGYITYGAKGWLEGVYDKFLGVPIAVGKAVLPGAGKFNFNPNESRTYKQIVQEGLKEHALRAKVKTIKGVASTASGISSLGKGVAKAGIGAAKLGVGALALPGAAYRFSKQSLKALNNANPAVRAGAALGIAGGAYWGGSAMQGHLDKRNEERAASTGGYYGKTASESVDGLDKADKTPANIPVDTSTPNSNQPLDSVDYFDYQEWANSDQPYPDRGESETTKYVSAQKPVLDTRKVASILNMDASVVLAYEDYSTGRERIKTSGVADTIIDAGIDLANRKGYKTNWAKAKAQDMAKPGEAILDNYIRNTSIKDMLKDIGSGVSNSAHMAVSGSKLLGGALATGAGVAATAGKKVWKNKGYLPYAYLAAPDSVHAIFKRKPKSNAAHNARLIGAATLGTAAAAAAATYYNEGNHQWNPYYLSR